MFKGMLISLADGAQRNEIREFSEDELPHGSALVRVLYSGLNYKDALAVTGKGKVIRMFPMVPGIDLAGEIISSENPAYRPGDLVLITGSGLGELHWGGYAQMARVPAEWLVPIPQGMSAESAMIIGTAGFTAMLSVMAIEMAGAVPDGREVLVTGATGGVGSIATALLAHAGYSVCAVTGRMELADYLRELGAKTVMRREDALNAPQKPLASERWDAVIDSVGGETLAAAIRACSIGAPVAACGLTGGANLALTVMPFILRGVALLGIDSLNCPYERRLQAWKRLAADLTPEALAAVGKTHPFSDIERLSAELMQGHIRGHAALDMSQF